MTFTTLNRSFTFFGLMAFSPRFTLLSIAVTLTLFLIGCFDQEVTDRMNESAERVCQGVTEENWGHTHDMCLGRAMHQFNNSTLRDIGKPYLNQVRACSIGGLPHFCEDRGTEFMIWTPSGHPVIFNQTLANRARESAVYFDIEPKYVSVAIMLDPNEGRDLWLNQATWKLERSTFQKTSPDYIGFVGVRSPGMPTGWRIWDAGSESIYDVVIEFSYPEGNVKVTIDDPHDNHCIGYTRVDDAGVIVIVNAGPCRPAITRLTYDYADVRLQGF